MQTLYIATVLAALGVSSAGSEYMRLDSFFEGIDSGCRATEAFRGFQSSLAVQDPLTEKWLPGPLILPGGIREAFGPPSLEEQAFDRAFYVKVSVPVKGMFHRFRISKFEYARGLNNGITIYWLRLAAPVEAVRAALGHSVAEGNERLKRELAPHSVNELLSDGNETLVLCDVST